MARKIIDPSLKKKYTGATENREKKSGASGRNLGLLSLFFVLLSLVLIVGKLTLEGKLAADPPNNPSSLPTVTRTEIEQDARKASIAGETAAPELTEESLPREEPP